MKASGRQSAGQQRALDDLADLAAEGPSVEVLGTDLTLAPGLLLVTVALDCSGIPHEAAGIRVRPRERFDIALGALFPCDPTPPTVSVRHSRWAGYPHVQQGRQICLYAAPSVEWVPADGVRGLLERLTTWLERASLGDLDPDGQPLHPPVAYTRSTDLVVMRADIGLMAPPERPHKRVGDADPTTSHQYRLVVALCENHGDGRIDVVEWIDRTEWMARYEKGQLGVGPTGRPIVGVLGVLTDGEIGFEYPSRADALVLGLVGLGVDRSDFLASLGEVAAVNSGLAAARAGKQDEDADLRVLVGTPSRRADGTAVPRQHLVCWRVDDVGRDLAEFRGRASRSEFFPSVARNVESLADSWLQNSPANWIQVMEDRPEVTRRRDDDTSASWLRRKRILVLGAGALGAPVAEACVRAGAVAVRIVDSGAVSPGILVRQPYYDFDLGRSKAEALALRLNSIRSDVVEGIAASAQAALLADGLTAPDADLVIDATADSAVASLLELRRAGQRDKWPPVISMLVGHDALRGLATISLPGATGGGRDILRRLTIAARGHQAARLDDVAEDFFPLEPRTEVFQPEPGCSSPTFIGSISQLAGLAGVLFDAAMTVLSTPLGIADPMTAVVARLDGCTPAAAGVDRFGWANDSLQRDESSGYEVRLSRAAGNEMRAECRRGARVRGDRIETGGLLFGRADDACRVVWIDSASGPPPDSSMSAHYFEHGVEGIADLIEHHRQSSGLASAYLGMWHAHPYGSARPSPTDGASRHRLVAPAVGSPRRALMLIVGGDEDDQWTGWLNDDGEPSLCADLVSRRSLGLPVANPPVPQQHRLESWPGGWARMTTTISRPRRRDLFRWVWPWSGR